MERRTSASGKDLIQLVRGSLDVSLFLRLSGGCSRSRLWLDIAICISKWSWLLAVLIMARAVAVSGLLEQVTIAAVTGGLFQVIIKQLARRTALPRPFMLGLCENHLGHSLRGGMPSTHAAVLAYLAGYLGAFASAAPALAALMPLAMVTGWARIRAGAHFPSDVFIGLALGLLTGASMCALIG